MFNLLRFKLTTSSILKMLALMSLISGMVYTLVTYHLGYVTDQALREQMVLEYLKLGLPLPPDLSVTAQNLQVVGQLKESYDDNDDKTSLIMPLDAKAQLVLLAPDDLELRSHLSLPYQEAAQSAEKSAFDLRTIYTRNGTHVRLFTHRLPLGAPVAFLQIRRRLADDDRIKHGLLLALFVAGVGFAVVSGVISWWLAGRSLQPTQHIWERQQAFIANASHELRTPLTLVRVSAQVVQRSIAPDSPHRQLLEDVMSETDYMSKLVDDMLLLSRLDADQLKLDLCTIQLSDLLSQIQRPFNSLADTRGVSVRIDRSEGVVLADPIRLRQVLLIVIDNALRHTPAGDSIILDSRVREGVVHISVTDTGQGIALEDLPHVFERFYNANNANANGSGGDWRSAGLGLSIAKPLVELHQGAMTIDSTPGIGTRVTITLSAQTVLQVSTLETGWLYSIAQAQD